MATVLSGIALAGFTVGRLVHPDVTLEANSGSGWAPLDRDTYRVHSELGILAKRAVDDNDSAVDWDAYVAYQDAGNTAFRATYWQYNPGTNTAAQTGPEDQTFLRDLELAIPPFDPDTGQLNETTKAAGRFLVGDYLSLGAVGTRPTDSTHGTGIWADATGIYGLASNVQQSYMRASDGKILAGAGNVVLDTSGVNIDADGSVYIRFGNSDDANGVQLDSRVTSAVTYLSINTNSSGYADTAYTALITGGSNGAMLRVEQDDTVSKNWVSVSAINNFVGFRIGSQSVPSARLHISHTAPDLLLEDTTASAKDGYIKVDGNNLTIGEYNGGSPTTLVTLALATGAVTLADDLAVNGGDLTSSATTFNLLNATVTTANVLGAGTAITWGATSGYTNIKHKLFLNETSDANTTTGITINQGAADDAVLALKSSDVAHGITDYSEDDTYALFKKQTATTGGLLFLGSTENVIGFDLWGLYTNDTTTKSTSANAAVQVTVGKKSGTGVGAAGANANMMIIRDVTATRFIFDADGDSHQDVGTAWTNFDDHDDVAVLNALAANVTRPNDPLRASFGEWLGKHRDQLERMKLVQFNDDTDGHAFVNMSKLTMLLVGATRQLGARVAQLERKLLEAN